MIFGSRNRRNDGEDLRITLIESPTIPTVGVGEATTLSMQLVIDLLALDEKDFFANAMHLSNARCGSTSWTERPTDPGHLISTPLKRPIIFTAIRPPIIIITAACTAASGWIRWPMPCCR